MRNIFLLAILIPSFVLSQSPEIIKVKQYAAEKQHEIMGSYVQLLAIPNIASDIKNIQRNAVENCTKIAISRIFSEIFSHTQF